MKEYKVFGESLLYYSSFTVFNLWLHVIADVYRKKKQYIKEFIWSALQLLVSSGSL